MNRKGLPVPEHHRLAPNLLSLLSGVGSLFLIWGLWRLQAWPTMFGAVLIYAGKVWFLDRMVWLYEDMRTTTEEYSRWLYSNGVKQSSPGDTLKATVKDL